MGSEDKSKKSLERSMKELKIGVASKGSDENMHGPKDGSSFDAMSCISSGDATSSIKGSEVDQEAPMADQIMYYPLNGFYGYYYPGFDGSMGDWDNNGYFFGTDGSEIQHSATEPENESLVYYFPGFHAGYSFYSPVSPVVGGDGQYFTQHLYQPSPIFHQPLVSSGYIAQSVAYPPEHFPAYVWDSGRDPTTPYPNPSYSSQNHAVIPPKASVSPLSAALSKQGAAAALDASRNSAMQNQTLKPKGNNEVSKGYAQANNFNSYPSPEKNSLLIPNMTSNAKTTNKAWIGSEKQIKTNQTPGTADFDMLNEQNRGPRTTGSQGAWISGYDSTAGSEVNDSNGTLVASIKKEDYNLPDFTTNYDQAIFFVIKSYSEDDIHKSIKYNVWASTPNGNKRLENAYQAAQQKAAEKGCKCPVLLFFSVNASGQFCGVAEMIGQVDFNKSMNFWQQDKWNGYFPVKWHIIKDIPNAQFRHIILENNDNKPVTNSRDTQEVKFPQGTEMLNIFKNYSMKTSILDDFNFYETRQKAMQDRRTKTTITLMPKTEAAVTAASKPLDARIPKE
ncbi:YTH domain-containing family protein 3-like [Phalaenopsis equestris]|uniref:YTH domain-containing family protein 3-like n=1 Tax=Phalaenopsis equestris TaxID=78828 RepID=UPI0009E1F949|nr:YTH domain-containing family protein 3-like [Phalaenopsis equestris]XP_020578769.1 YTH domain-containing family protein 3-like [Phalaenopsis equestris]